MPTNKSCTNCPGATDHDTAHCPLRVIRLGDLNPQQRLALARGQHHEQAEGEPCQGRNCTTTESKHSPECLLEASITFGCDKDDLREAAEAVFEKVDAMGNQIAQLRRAEHAEGAQGEREAFEAWVKTFNSMPAALFQDERGRYVDDWIQCRWMGWQARAVLAQPSPAPELLAHDCGGVWPITGHIEAGGCPKCGPDFVHADKKLEALLNATALVIESPGHDAAHYWAECMREYDEAHSPTPELERPEVVAHFAIPTGGSMAGEKFPKVGPARDYDAALFKAEDLILLSEFDRIVGALRAEAERNKRTIDGMNEAHAKLAGLYEAAQAGVAELEKRESTPEITIKVHAALIAAQKTIFENRFLNDEMYELFELAVRGQKELAGMLAAPVAQAGQVPDEFSFEYRHPNGERHTVWVSREQVLEQMPDFIFEALCDKFCNCRPVGETNVVECCCDEYAEEFQLVAAAPAQGGE